MSQTVTLRRSCRKRISYEIFWNKQSRDEERQRVEVSRAEVHEPKTKGMVFSSHSVGESSGNRMWTNFEEGNDAPS